MGRGCAKVSLLSEVVGKRRCGIGGDLSLCGKTSMWVIENIEKDKILDIQDAKKCKLPQ